MTTTPESAVEVPPVIEGREITKRYGALTALQGVDLKINAGEIVGLVGDNGAGKSTLIKILSGALQPTSGELLVDGEPIGMHSPLQARRAVPLRRRGADRHALAAPGQADGDRDRLPGSRARARPHRLRESLHRSRA